MPSAMLASIWDTPIWPNGFLYWWQIPAFILLIAIIIFWVMYRRKQM
jgi:hypothetical protein